MAYNVGGNSLAQPFIEYKIFSDEFVFKAALFYLTGILNNATVKLKHIPEALVFQPCAGLFTPYATCAVHQQVFVFVFAQQFFGYLQFFAKSIHIGTQGIFKMSNFTFIVIAHIQMIVLGSSARRLNSSAHTFIPVSAGLKE